MRTDGDYISREAALKRLCKDVCNVSDCQCDEIRCVEWFVIRDVPAADVRPVVLCRDCQYFENDCGWCGYFDIGMNVNDFCSRGKREES